MRENYLEIRMKKSDGELKPTNNSYKELYDMFVKNVDDGQTVYVFFEACEANSTIRQKRLFNLNVRKIAERSGTAFDDIKKLIKERCGLEYKSTEDMSSDEMNLLFEEIRSICNELDIPTI